MPASSLSKIAVHLSRFASWQAQQAAHSGANAFKSSFASTSTGGAAGSGGSAASASLSGAGAAGPGSGAAGAKFHAGRGAHYTYTNTGGRAVIQAGSTSTNDVSNTLDDEEEHPRSLLASPAAPRRSDRRNSIANDHIPSHRRSLLSPTERDAVASHHAEVTPLTRLAMQAMAGKAWTTSESAPDVASPELIPVHSGSAELYRDLIDAKNRKDRIAVTSLVEAYRNLPRSEKTTAGYNVAINAQVSVRRSGDSLQPIRETHMEMINDGFLPNGSTSAALVKALCARDEEKQAPQSAAPQVTREEEASSEAWRVLTTSPAGLNDITAYNALLSRCAAKGESERALAVFRLIEEAPGVHTDADSYLAMLQCFAQTQADGSNAELVGSRVSLIKQTLTEAITAMKRPDWVNEKDSLVFKAFIGAAFQLKAPEEAIAIFMKMISNEDGLPSPTAEITGALVDGIAAEDLAAAADWISKIESVNSSASEADEKVLAAPDFSTWKKIISETDSSQLPVSATSAAQEVKEALVAPASEVECLSPPSSEALSLLGSVDSNFVSQHSEFSPASTGLTELAALPVVDHRLGEQVKMMLRAPRNNIAKNGRKNFSHQGGGHLDQAYKLLMQEVQRGVYAPPEVVGQLLNLYGRERNLPRVHELRQHAHAAAACLSHDPNWQQSAWACIEDSVVSALAHGGDLEAAHSVKNAMIIVGCPPSADSYAALISSIRDSTDEAMLAEQLYEESQRLRVQPNIYLVNTVISRLGRARRADRALALYNSLPALGLKPTSITYGATSNCAVRVGDVSTAEAIFAAMEADPHFVARPPGYNSMIQFFTYTKPDRSKALEYWAKMQARGVAPSSHTYKLLLDLYGTIAPVDVDSMNALFAQLLRDRSVVVAGPHWAALITCYGSHLGDIGRCQRTFRSISLRTGNAPDAVAFEALLQVYAQHGELELIDSLLAEMVKSGVPRTAYVANAAIDAYARHGGQMGLMMARAIFMAMSQPPAGVASVGNHPLPRHHGAGSGSGSLYTDRRSTLLAPSLEEADVDVQAILAQTSSHSSQRTSLTPEQKLSLLTVAFEQVHPEPSTYEKMIQHEMAHRFYMNASVIVQRMEERAFPPALVLKARALLNGEAVRTSYHPSSTSMSNSISSPRSHAAL